MLHVVLIAPESDPWADDAEVRAMDAEAEAAEAEARELEELVLHGDLNVELDDIEEAKKAVGVK